MRHILVLSCSCLADRRCSNYIWVINNLIAYWGAVYIKCLTLSMFYCDLFLKEQNIHHLWCLPCSLLSVIVYSATSSNNNAIQYHTMILWLAIFAPYQICIHSLFNVFSCMRAHICYIQSSKRAERVTILSPIRIMGHDVQKTLL